MHPSLEVYRSEVFEYIHKDFEIDKLAGDCLFTEGPVWNPAGFYLFSDITANLIYKITTGGKKEIYLLHSGTTHPDDPDLKKDQAGSNGLAYDAAGHLLICQHGSHAIARYDGQQVQPFITQYNGRPLNSPNDLIVHNDGRIFFSDPPYGLKDGKPNPEKFQSLAGVFCWEDGALKRICDRYQYPNGVCLDPEQRKLFICSHKPFEKFISIYDLDTNSFAGVLAEENSDGMETDPHGNVYLCNSEGIILLDHQGKRLAKISLPTVPANACWGPGGDLFVTARENIFLIRGLLR